MESFLMKVTRRALYLISKFVLLSLDQYLCWWTIIPREYHPPSSQCFGTAMVYQIYLLLKSTVAMFIKSKIILPQAEANLAECSDPVQVLWFYWSPTLLNYSNLSILSVPGERYSRNAACALNLISTFLFVNRQIYEPKVYLQQKSIIQG